MAKNQYDAVVIGSGPNGLTAAVVLARAGLSVLVLEGAATPGGSCRTAELTLPGFHHDVCAAVHPIGALSPAFEELRLDKQGLQWVQADIPLAHVLNDRAVFLKRSLQETASGLASDEQAWTKLFLPFRRQPEVFFREVLRPVRFPSRPLLMARFGFTGLRSCLSVLESHFKGVAARALFAGCAAHSALPLDASGTAAFGLMLTLPAYIVGWPCALGGSGQVISALEKCLLAAGGEIRCNQPVLSLDEVPASRVVLFDLTPRQVLKIAGKELPRRYVCALERFRYGMGIFKVDWALDGPVPWRDSQCLQAGTVHLGGSAEEVMQAEATTASGQPSKTPFVLVAQQSLFDATRAPVGKQTLWAYCHVSAGCNMDMTERIEAQVERFAPGFRDRILARHTRGPREYEQYNPNLIGGDIGGGANNLWQFLFRPVARYDPYSTPNPRLFICSSSTPPGGGVHGMCGYWAAQSALRRAFGRSANV